jgi:hypothetical protein
VPLKVELNLNSDRLHNLTIGRLEEYKGPDVEHEYIAILDDDYSTAVTFRHLYSDGALRCLERALQALRQS